MHWVKARTSERIFRFLILLVLIDAIREGELKMIILAFFSTFCWLKSNDVGVSKKIEKHKAIDTHL